MPGDFQDHARKRVIRDQWNDPLLQFLHQRWGRKFTYMGLPGQEALDVNKWASMIDHVIAFEAPDDDAEEPRHRMAALGKELALLEGKTGITNQVYYGPMERVVLTRQDLTGKPFQLDRFVQLFNLDFCDCITSKILTPNGRKCQRFDAIRCLLELLVTVEPADSPREFVFFITARNSFHVRQVMPFLESERLPRPTQTYLGKAIFNCSLPRRGMADGKIEVLRVFVYTFLRKYFLSHGIVPVFLPPVAYQGGSGRTSPMAHFAVACRTALSQGPQPTEVQRPGDFFKLSTLWADDNHISKHPEAIFRTNAVTDPVALLENSGLLC